MHRSYLHIHLLKNIPQLGQRQTARQCVCMSVYVCCSAKSALN